MNNSEDELTLFNDTFKIHTKLEKIQKQKEKMIDPADIFVGVKSKKGKSYRKSEVDKKIKSKTLKDFM